MIKLLISLGILFSVQAGFAQSYHYSSIPKDLIIDSEGEYRDGSCDSPNGTIVCDELATYPTYTYLETNGCCYTISPPVKDGVYCWEFIALNSSLILDSGFSVLCFASCGWSFINFELYTCSPDCVLVGTGLSFTGLTVGQCYTWCFETDMIGGGPGGGFDEFCPYVIQTPVLPVELTGFDCLSGQDEIQLTWTTESETNNEAFNILRSADGSHFEEIGSVPGNGTTTLPKFYTFIDDAPFPGNNYYKLEQVDMYNAGSTPSDVIICSTSDDAIETIYYNLVGELVEIDQATSGIYIQEIVTELKRYRQLVLR